MENIILQEEIEFSATIHLSEASNKRNQLIYGSSSYGTMYCVYAKFNIEEKKNNRIIIKDIAYTIVNYKGVVNIGFKEKPEFKISDDKESLIIDIKVKGFSKNNKTTSKNKNIELDNSFKKLVVDRKLLPLKGENPPSQIHEGLFDEEFFYRDGNFNKKRPKYDTMTMEESDTINNDDKEFVVPGIRCRQGVNFLIF